MRPLGSVRFLALILLASAGMVSARAADPAPGQGTRKAEPAVETPETALRRFTVAPGLRVDLFAAEPDVRNPVAFCIDEQGRVFVVESDRRRSSVFDIRGHADWLEADLATAATNRSPAVRLCALLALRRLGHPDVARLHGSSSQTTTSLPAAKTSRSF